MIIIIENEKDIKNNIEKCTSTILKTAKLSLKISRGMLALLQHVPTVIKNTDDIK